MNDKYSLAKCEQYGRRLAAKLCDQYFTTQPDATIDGPALLKFTSVRQINLLVLQQLLTQWQADATRLRSPYFDFEAEAVKSALTQFMNVLSRHIRLTRAALEPLLARATSDTLGIVADPAGTFQKILLGTTDAPTIAGLRDNLRYLDIDKAFYQGFLESIPTTGELSRDFVSQRFALYHTANYKAHQPMQRLVGELSSLLPLTAADLLEDGPVASSAPAAAAPTSPSSSTAESTSAPAPIPTAPKADINSTPVFTPPVAEIPVVSAPSAATPPAVPSFIEKAPSAAVNSSEDAVPLHEKLKASQSAMPLAETLRATATITNLGERAAPKVATLREAISINQRFSFINELFNGENMEYHAAIQHLDSLPTAEQARTYVNNDLTKRYDWERKEEHVNKLLKLIERKFAV